MLKPFPLQMSEADVAGWFNILNPNITNGCYCDYLTVNALLLVGLLSTWLRLCQDQLSNMCAARAFRLYKYAFSYEKRF